MVQMLGLHVRVYVHLGSEGEFTIKTAIILRGPLVNHQGVLGAKSLSTLKALTDEWLSIGLHVII